MSMLSAQDRETVRQRLDGEMQDSVTLTLYTQRTGGLTVPGRGECVTCDQTQELLEELTSLSPRMPYEDEPGWKHLSSWTS